MTNLEFAKKHNISLKVARLVQLKEPTKIKVATFNVYDSSNPEDPELIKMNAFLRKNPNCEKAYWQDSGPCSNWGYDIYRMETKKEYNKRIKKDIKRAEKDLKWLKINKEVIDELSKKCSFEINIKKKDQLKLSLYPLLLK